MTHEFAQKADNVFMIDAGMFGFKNYMSVYLVQGKELALVDTGLPDSLENVRAGIKAHGFSVQDIDHIFITHEHHDHSGNLGPLMRENPRIKAHIHQLGIEWVKDPNQEAVNRQKNLGNKMANRFASMEAVPAEKLIAYKDGDVFDLGDGVRLKVTFSPGHQPGGVMIMEEKYKGLFINDLVGNCFADCGDFQLILNPPRSDLWAGLEMLKEITKWDVNRLYLGHFGIRDDVDTVVNGAIERIEELLDTCAQCNGDRELMVSKLFDLKMVQIEKLKARGPELYDYLCNELVAAQSRIFADMYLGRMAG